MKREILKLEATRFTSESALAREVLALLEQTDAKVIVLADDKALERIASELEDRVVMGRVKIVRLAAEDTSNLPELTAPISNTEE